MINLPEKTIINKKIPKNKFYENIKIDSTAKRYYVEQINSIVWVNKISEDTVNVKSGASISEIEVLQINLIKENIDWHILDQIDKAIPYKKIIVLSNENKRCFVAKHTDNMGKSSWISSSWIPDDHLSLSLSGLDLDNVWENLIVQIGNITVEDGRTLDEQIKLNAKRAQLEKEIEKLEKQARKEVQPKMKFKIYQEIQKLKGEKNER